jgi:tRNA(Ile)-lysidine synthase
MAVRRRAFRRLWRTATGSRRGLDADHVEAVMRHLRAPHPKRISLPGGREARMGRGILEVVLPEPRTAPLPCLLLQGPGTYVVSGTGTLDVAWASSDPPPWPLEARGRRAGDRFHPAGAPGGKKLKAWLIDRKVPRARREALMVIADRDGHVLCIPELGARSSRASGLEVRWRAS